QVAELKSMLKKEGIMKVMGHEDILKLLKIVKGTLNRVKLLDYTLYEGNNNLEVHMDDHVTQMKVPRCDGK
uniref:hypothetical protein n=1 Tax=Vibrio vulnificus TaxID=672 RepID=UPI0019D46C9A